MSQLYTYPFSDFTSSPGNLPKNRKLLADIEAAALGEVVEWISEDPDAGAGGECTVSMAAAITKADLDTVVAAHDGIEIQLTQVMETSHLASGESTITVIDPTRETIDGMTTDPRTINAVMSKVGFIVMGELWTDGSGAKLWLVENNDGVSVDVASYVVPNTASSWQPFMFKSSVDPTGPDDGFNSYVLEGATADGVVFKVRFLGVSLTLEKGN